jgi:hypothetical protein
MLAVLLGCLRFRASRIFDIRSSAVLKILRIQHSLARLLIMSLRGAKRRGNPFFVMPTKVGIQIYNWIPASAGMT